MTNESAPSHTGKALSRRFFSAFETASLAEIDLPNSLEEYMHSLNSKPFHEIDKRMRKVQIEIGPLTFTIETEADAVDAHAKLYASIESRWRKSASGTALSPGHAQARFYADLLRPLAATGLACMFTLKTGTRYAAEKIALEKNGILFFLKTRHEPELQNFGPGVMIQYFIVLYGYEPTTRIRHIEFYGSFNESQKTGGTGTRSNYHGNTYRSNQLTKLHCHHLKTRSVTSTTVEIATPWLMKLTCRHLTRQRP